jgi:hypothetical protein
MSDAASDDLHWHLLAMPAILTVLLLRKRSVMLYGNFEASDLGKRASLGAEK